MADPARAKTLRFGVEVFTIFRGWLHVAGWAFDTDGSVRAVGVSMHGEPPRLLVPVGLASPDIAAAHGPHAATARFSGTLRCTDSSTISAAEVCFLTDAGWIHAPDALGDALAGDAFAALWPHFLDELRSRPPGQIVEVGSRGKSGEVYSEQLPAGWSYRGFDIMAGPNVDIVGDAHALSTFVEPGSLDAVVSVATFEHLAMPWQAALEIGKVLRIGGVCCVVTHQSWPVHEQPWDYWRFSEFSWPVLFNEATGFEVVEAVMGQPGRVVPDVMNAITADMPQSVGYLGTSVIARKVAEPRAVWDVSTKDIVRDFYPH